MTSRRTIGIVLLAAILIGIAALYFRSPNPTADGSVRASDVTTRNATTKNADAPKVTRAETPAARTITPLPPPPPVREPIQDAPSHLADDLNSPAGNIRRD